MQMLVIVTGMTIAVPADPVDEKPAAQPRKRAPRKTKTDK